MDLLAWHIVKFTIYHTAPINFFGDQKNYGDVRTINTAELPDFDFLIGGFPCQTSSVVGKRQVFDDSRGLIIYGLLKILIEKDVPFFILKNVKGLVNHDKWQTLQTILSAISNAGYDVEHRVLNSIDYGVPQMRERIYLVGVKKGLQAKKFKWPETCAIPNLGNYLIDTENAILDINDYTFQKYLNNKYNKGKHNIDDILNHDYLMLDWRRISKLCRGSVILWMISF